MKTRTLDEKWTRFGAKIALTMALLPTGCGDMCGNHKLADNVSPNGQWNVVVFQRDCGATTGFSTQVSLLRVGDALPDAAGNVFVADTDHGAAPSGPGGGPEVLVQWETDDRVLISYDPGARVFKAEKQWSNVEVRYGGLN